MIKTRDFWYDLLATLALWLGFMALAWVLEGVQFQGAALALYYSFSLSWYHLFRVWLKRERGGR